MILELLQKVILASFDILNSASVWLVISFILAGLMHNLLSPDRLHRTLGNRKISSLVKATLSGMLLPICSCGVIPLGVGLYYSGAYLGPTLAFMTATPIINPAAILLAYGFLGPQIATIYLATGFVAPILIGMAGNALAGRELHAPGMENPVEMVNLESGAETSLAQKLSSGLHWGFFDMGVSVSKYVCIGMLLAGLMITLVPASFIQQYLGSPGMISIAGIAVLGAIMYVCAVGHIPFIAALIASGAAPGLAITFLMTGAATNLPELISMYKMIGRRTVVIYITVLTLSSLFVGYLTNLYLLPGFVPFFDLTSTRQTIGLANSLIFSAPGPLRYLCSAIITALGLHALWPGIKRALLKERVA
ncbi:putative permease [Pelotomaculum schinkii]|uniref:Putative permease n=1 Tax=Pelotomaculum schinkii TaxID=78350 RepID=A0A4Y7RFH4_9FIRM|nr:efflux transporter SaoE [Pelotomaculum schinkii]TEB07533.1 putative permease [Pelotomaculum schinkii]